MKKKLLEKNTAGQATIEFALALILFIAFILFYFQLTQVLAFGNYVHYATFMAARAYLASGQDVNDQRTRAQDYIVEMLKKSAGQTGTDKFPGIARATGGDGTLPGYSINPPSNYSATDVNFSWLQGARYTFTGKLFLIPLAGPSAAANADLATVNKIVLTSESWLGREAAYDECQKSIGGIFDNGC